MSQKGISGLKMLRDYTKNDYSLIREGLMPKRRQRNEKYKHNSTTPQYSSSKSYDIISKLIDQKLSGIYNYLSPRSIVSQAYKKATDLQQAKKKTSPSKNIRQFTPVIKWSTKHSVQKNSFAEVKDWDEVKIQFLSSACLTQRRNEMNKVLDFSKSNTKIKSGFATATYKSSIQDFRLDKKIGVLELKKRIPKGIFSKLGQGMQIKQKKKVKKATDTNKKIIRHPITYSKMGHDSTETKKRLIKSNDRTTSKSSQKIKIGEIKNFTTIHSKKGSITARERNNGKMITKGKINTKKKLSNNNKALSFVNNLDEIDEEKKSLINIQKN